MEIIKADWVEKANLEQLLQKKVKKLGYLEKYQVVFRPFKRVTLTITGKRSDDIMHKDSLIDAGLAPLVQDDDHRLLLWRPRYSNSSSIVDEDLQEPEINSDAVQRVIDDMMEKRWHAQDQDEEMKPKLRRLQVDPLSTISIIFPRTPGGLRKEQVLIENRKASHAYIFATSLVTNCTPKDIIISADIGNTVLIETIIATYQEDEKMTRVLALETPNTNSFKDAIKTGRALTRLCELYVECREVVSNAPK
ncbi:MAG: hypothetical protein E4H14_05220 [Candidatus Thorarchaeota archaeon]|nr:MAG: hypothetical protein E4H14_05220 [Candidatus Thorarchaeota archaeon]